MRADANIPLLQATAALIAVGILAFAGGVVWARESASTPGQIPGAPEGVDFSPVWKAWQLLDENFVPAAVSSTSLSAMATGTEEERRVWGMVQGLVGSLGDPYSFFLPPSDKEQFNDDLNGRFEGVGMEIAVRDAVLTVVAPLKGTPAERAGIKSGDLILEINAESTRGMDVTTAVRKIRGPKGSVVTLNVLRDSWSGPRDIDVTRDVINVPVVTTEQKEDGIFLITLATFTANSPDLFRGALREFVQAGSTKLILDLRGNPGGFLEAAVDIAGWFLPAGNIVVSEDYAGKARSFSHRSPGYDIFNDTLRVVILVDRGSASASEILADALDYYGVATLVGSPTFGKGSVQELLPVTDDTALKLTVARWLGPDGKQIPESGIEPDIEVELTEEDFQAGRDPQMDKAVEILRSQ